MPQPTHQHAPVDGFDLFYREAGPVNAPTVLLLHGSPSSSIQFRYMLLELSDRWRLIAPDLPPFGFTEPGGNSQYCFTFDNLASTLGRFVKNLGLNVGAVYLHDYGAQVGFRLLSRGIVRPKCLIIQNSEAYHRIGWHPPMLAVESRLGDSPAEARSRLVRNLLNEDGIRKEFLENLSPAIARRIDPAVVELAWERLNTPTRIDSVLDLLMDYGSNMAHYLKIQECLRANAFPTLILWGESDQYLSTEAAHAYRRDLPDAEFHFLNGGHWLLESHIAEVNTVVRNFLVRHLSVA